MHVRQGSRFDATPAVQWRGRPADSFRAAVSPIAALEACTDRYFDALAIMIVFGAFVVRLAASIGSFLNADEAIQYLYAAQPTFFQAYKASLTNAHPPLHILILHAFLAIGRSEWVLRMPSVLAGTAFCWYTFRWVRLAFGRGASLVSLILTAFTPFLIALSAENRGYALLLFFLAAALLSLERFLQHHSARAAWCYACFLSLALLSHYSAIFVAIAAGCYALVRLAESRPPGRVLIAWFAGQGATAALCAFLYVTQLSKLGGALPVMMRPYAGDFFRLDQEDLWSLTQFKTFRIFLYLFEDPRVAQIMFWLSAAAVTYILVRELLPGHAVRASRHLGLLLFLPLVLLWCAAVAGVYPFDSSRHAVFIAPFIVGAVSFLLAALGGQRLLAGALSAVLLVCVANASGQPVQPYISRDNQSLSLMNAALDHLQRNVAPGELIVVDEQTRFLIDYYRCASEKITPIGSLPSWPATERFDCGGHRFVSLNDLWKLLPVDFLPRFKEVAGAYSLKPGDRVWIFQAGWGLNLDTVLTQHSSEFRCLKSATFGENIAVIPFVVGPDMTPASPASSCPD